MLSLPPIRSAVRTWLRSLPRPLSYQPCYGLGKFGSLGHFILPATAWQPAPHQRHGNKPCVNVCVYVVSTSLAMSFENDAQHIVRLLILPRRILPLLILLKHDRKSMGCLQVQLSGFVRVSLINRKHKTTGNVLILRTVASEVYGISN